MAAIQLPYLGKPGSMRRLPAPRGPIDAIPSRQDKTRTLLSGGVAVANVMHSKRSYSIPYDELTAADADTLLNFYRGVYGVGPWRLVDPSIINVLPLDVATVGVRSQSAPGLVSSSGAIVTTTGPVDIPETAAVAWTAATNGHITPGSTVNTADLSAPPYLPLEAVTVSVYAKAAATIPAILSAYGFTAAGAITSTAHVDQAVTLTTAWQRFAVTVPAGAAVMAGAGYVLPRLRTTSSASTVSVAAWQLEYGDTLTPWRTGASVARVSFIGTPGRNVPQIGYSSHVLTLAER